MKNNYVKLLRCINREHTNELLEWLECHNFFTVPASKVNHNNFKGGLLKHSLEVCNEALALHHELELQKAEEASAISKESLVIASLLHDVCKWNVFYISPNDGHVRRNNKAAQEGHGLKSVRIIEETGFRLSEDEKLAIWWHMGKAHEPSYAGHEKQYEESLSNPLCNLIRKADYNATHLKERFEAAIRGLKLQNGEHLLEYLGNSNFYTKNCSSHHHYATGLVAHSLGVCRHILEICEESERHDAAVVALLHDIADQNRTPGYHGHGWRSMMILKERLQMDLPGEVFNMIRFHKNSDRSRSANEQALLDDTRKIPLFHKLTASDHFDAGHDITDVYKHYISD